MFRHVALLSLDPDTTGEQRAALLDAIRALPDAIPGIRSYAVGVDAGVTNGNHDVAIVADFDDRAAYEVYRDHPAHRAVLRDLLVPILAHRAAVQHDLA